MASGIDTFSKINYGDARKVVQNAGSAGLHHRHREISSSKSMAIGLDATDSIMGDPGRMTFLQAQNTLKTFAKETGGAYYPVTFEGELPKVLGIDQCASAQPVQPGF